MWQCKSRLVAEAELLKDSIASTLNEISSTSKIRYYLSPQAPACTSNKFSMHYLPQNDDERDQFIELLSDELLLRNLSPRGELAELRECLLVELILEHNLKQHLEKLLHCSKLEQCLIALLNEIPCILHCENRVGIKLLTMVLLEGFSNATEGLVFGNICSLDQRIQAYVVRIQSIFNPVILGDADGPAQWVIPMNNEGTNVGIICLYDNQIRKVLESFEIIIDASVMDATQIIKWKYYIPNYRDAIEILCQKKEFTDEEIKRFQHFIDNWFQVWIQLHGLSGCTNYTHMLSTGHLTVFMFKMRNMYRFSPQCWENFNHVFSTVYFRRTNRGGRRHEGAIKSKLVGIDGRWL
jgi:hypothetical protein